MSGSLPVLSLGGCPFLTNTPVATASRPRPLDSAAFLSFWQVSRLRWNCSRTTTSFRWIPSPQVNHQPLWRHDRAWPTVTSQHFLRKRNPLGGPGGQWHSPKSPISEASARPLQGPHAPSLPCARAPKSRHELAGSPCLAHATLSPIDGGAISLQILFLAPFVPRLLVYNGCPERTGHAEQLWE